MLKITEIQSYTARHWDSTPRDALAIISMEGMAPDGLHSRTVALRLTMRGLYQLGQLLDGCHKNQHCNLLAHVEVPNQLYQYDEQTLTCRYRMDQGQPTLILGEVTYKTPQQHAVVARQYDLILQGPVLDQFREILASLLGRYEKRRGLLAQHHPATFYDHWSSYTPAPQDKK